MNNIEEMAANVKAYQQTNIAKLWQKTRHLLGYGVNELAAELGTSGAQISRIESGEREPSAELIIKFSQLKEKTMSNVRFLTDDEVEAFPGDNFTDVAITADDGTEYYGESDETGDGNHQYVNDEDGEHVAVKTTK